MIYAIEQRLRFIDFILFYYGSINRAELVNFFGISSATATRDFTIYKNKAPNNMILNSSSKRWIKSDTFKRLYD